MPTTYTPLATTTVGTATPSVTLSGISGSYTDLVIVISAQGTSAGNDQDINMTFNSDTATNYSRTRLYGNGTSALSTRESNVSSITIGNMPAASSSLGAGNNIIQINNYSNTITNKTVIIRTNTGASWGTVFGIVGLWRSTAAITSVTFTPASGNFAVGSTFSLYGVASAAVVSGAKATGGDVVTTDGTYWYHAFRTSGTFTPTQALTCDYLVVAGGGGGGTPLAGGGGAGGLRSTVTATGGGGSLESALSLSANTGYTVTIGGGGAVNANGSNSVFSTITSTGGGRGGYYNAFTGATGGSGGGGGGGDGTVAGGSGTANQGYAGGSGNDGAPSYTTRVGGGGGGAGATGSNGVASVSGGNGGAGVLISTLATPTGTGVSGYYAGGGGGSVQASGTAGSGGAGGGGAGGANVYGTSGTANTGGGAGGTGQPSGTASNGGSGLVIVRYAV
jgi:hypothetical protein